eukprot:7379191-Prymnesium_polylepis.1
MQQQAPPTEDTGGVPPLPDSATDEELLARVHDSRMFAEMNLSFGDSEVDAASAVALLQDALAHARRLRGPRQQHLAQELVSMLERTRATDDIQHKAEDAELAAAIKLSLGQDADAQDASDGVLLDRALALFDVANSHLERDDDSHAKVRIERQEDASKAIQFLEQARSYAMRLSDPRHVVMQAITANMGRIYFALSELHVRQGRFDDSIK